MNKEDGLLAVKNGANALWISNSGGRGLDTQPSTISVLKSISKAVRAAQPETQIFIDGGFRRGTDVIKALAMGANCVFLGRPLAWALSYKGKDGVKEMIEMLNEEFKLCMALTNTMEVNKISEECVIHSYRPKL